MTRYPELRRFTNRLFNNIERLGGFVFYVGVRKTAAPGTHNPNRLYARVFLEAIKRIDDYCGEDSDTAEGFVLILDEHEQRAALLTEAAKSMYGRHQRRRHLIEPPFHLESHRYQTIQAADWIAGLVGGWERFGPIRARGPRTRRSDGTSSDGSIGSAAGAESGIEALAHAREAFTGRSSDSGGRRNRRGSVDAVSPDACWHGEA